MSTDLLITFFPLIVALPLTRAESKATKPGVSRPSR